MNETVERDILRVSYDEVDEPDARIKKITCEQTDCSEVFEVICTAQEGTG